MNKLTNALSLKSCSLQQKNLMSLVSRSIGIRLMVTGLAISITLSSAYGLPQDFKQDQGQFQSESLANFPEGWESYLSRPDILSVKAEPGAEIFDSDWGLMKRAHFSFVAQILATYDPKTQIYFLARDSEYIYDVAKLVTQGTPDAERIHLLNISQDNIKDPKVFKYLASKGISESELLAGKKVLFIDTGFEGSIPQKIIGSFSNAARLNIQVHLIVSLNSRFPSSRTFLAHLEPKINAFFPNVMRYRLVSYELMPRYTDRSTRFITIDGRYHPISQTDRASDGVVSREMSLSYMQDLKYAWSQEDTKAHYHREFQTFTWLSQVAREPGSEFKIKQKLELVRDPYERHLFEAKIRDFAEYQRINYLQVFNLGLMGLKVFGVSDSSKQPELRTAQEKQRAEWKDVISQPEFQVTKLIETAQWATLNNLIEAQVNTKIEKILIHLLFDREPEIIRGLELQRNFIRSMTQESLRYFIVHFLSQPKAYRHFDIWLSDVIKRINSPELAASLARYVFSKPHTHRFLNLLESLVHKSLQLNSEVPLSALAQYTFSQPHTRDAIDALKLLIQNGSEITLMRLAEFTFSQPHTLDMVELVRTLVGRSSPDAFSALSIFRFSSLRIPHSEVELLKKAIELEDLIERKMFLSQQPVPRALGQEAPGQVSLGGSCQSVFK